MLIVSDCDCVGDKVHVSDNEPLNDSRDFEPSGDKEIVEVGDCDTVTVVVAEALWVREASRVVVTDPEVEERLLLTVSKVKLVSLVSDGRLLVMLAETEVAVSVVSRDKEAPVGDELALSVSASESVDVND